MSDNQRDRHIVTSDVAQWLQIAEIVGQPVDYREVDGEQVPVIDYEALRARIEGRVGRDDEIVELRREVGELTRQLENVEDELEQHCRRWFKVCELVSLDVKKQEREDEIEMEFRWNDLVARLRELASAHSLDDDVPAHSVKSDLTSGD